MKIFRNLGIIAISLVLTGCAGVLISTLETEPVKTKPTLTKALLIEEKGEPSYKKGDIWVYELNSKNWVGAIPFVIVPLPLVIPVSEERIEYKFSEEILESATLYTTQGYGGICGLVFAGHNYKFGCI